MKDPRTWPAGFLGVRGNKYGAKKTPGLTSSKMYPSALERNRAEYLKAMQADKEIEHYEEQPRVWLAKYHSYHPDFVYMEGGRWVFEDAKGAETERFHINCNLWREKGPGVLRISKQGKRGFRYRDIHPDIYDFSLWRRAP